MEPHRHEEKLSQLVHYPPSTVFDVVADVGHYSEFLPFIMRSRVVTSEREIRSNVTSFDADIEVGFQILKDQFRSRVELHHPNRHIVARCVQSNVVDGLETFWSFIPRENDTTEVVCRLSVTICDPLKATALSSIFSHMAKAQMRAFEKEIEQRSSKRPIHSSV